MSTSGLYYKAISGRDFIRAADADKDGIATREELMAAVKPYAGDDGKLDEAERRKVLVDGKLAIEIDQNEAKAIAGWGSSNVVTAYEAARSVLQPYDLRDANVKDDGSAAIKISDVQPEIPWGPYQKFFATGPITSVRPAMAEVDAAGNNNGLLSVREMADWIVAHHSDPSLVAGHVAKDPDGFAAILKPQQLGRIDARSLDGHIYYDTKVPKADVDRHYQGSIPTYIDSIKGVKELRGGAAWEPDPQSGTEATPKNDTGS